MRKAAPRVSVYCKCGAQWHGEYTIDNPVIAFHLDHCGPPLSEQQYVLVTKRRPRIPWKEATPKP